MFAQRRIITKFIVSLLAVMGFGGCVDVEAPEDLNKIEFDGLKEIKFEDASTLLSWDKPRSGDATRFHVYMKEVELLGDPLPEPQPMYMEASELPKTTGSMIKIVEGYEYPLDRNLDNGKTYAFQVVAINGDQVDENQRVLALTYQGQDQADDALKLTIESGDLQFETVGSKFKEPLKVKLTKFGRPLKGEEISFEITKGNGASLSDTSDYTDAEGMALTYFTAGSTEQTYKVKASYGEKAVYFAVIAKAETSSDTDSGSDSSSTDAVVLEIVSGNSQVDDIGSTFDDPLVVKLRDGSTGMAGKSITFGITTMPAGATGTSLSFSTVTTDANGQASISFTAGNLAGTYEITASYESKFVKFSQIATNTSQTPALIVSIAGDSQTPVVNNNLSTPLKVKVTDASAQPIAGVAVNFTAVSGGGAIVTAQPVVTDANGFAETIVKVGTIVTNNIFKAEVVSDTSLNVSFSALPTPGPAAKLAFSQQPGQAFQNFKFFTQPVVAIQDTYGNLVSTAVDTVSLSVKTGTGALSDDDGGAVTATASSGVATFSTVEYDTSENGVVLTASATGLSSVDSTSFDVGTLNGACATEDANWETADGGCKDKATGLVWSKPNTTGQTWYAVVWNAFAAGGGGLNEVEASDNGWTNEYQASQYLCNNSHCDNDPAAYCHNLEEGGYSDWRTPVLSEMQAANGNGIYSHVAGLGSTYYWSAWPRYDNNEYYRVRFSSWDQRRHGAWYTAGAICVRGGSGKPAAAKLEFEPWETGAVAVTNTAFSVTVKVLSANDTQVNAEGTSVTLSLASGTGSLSGTLTTTTDSRGYALFTNVLYDTAETIELTATASGLSSPGTNLSLPVSTYPGGCGNPDGNWSDAGGGCKDGSTGLVWSKISDNTMIWRAAMWDASVAGAGAIEASDNGWSNEYWGTSVTPCQKGGCDNVAAGYCHDLVEGGQSDWALPDINMMKGAWSAGLKDQRPMDGKNFWGRDRRDSNDSYYLNGSDNNHNYTNWDNSYYVICVRGAARPAIDNLTSIGVDSPHGYSSGLHAEVNQTFGLRLRFFDNTDTPVFRSGVDVTLTKASGTGTLSGTLTRTTDQAGVATFDDLSYDTVETFTISISNNAGVTNGSDITVNVSNFPGGCLQESASFTSANGGCQHTGSSLIFSQPTSYTVSSKSSSANYCTNLVEGGYSDWRLPASSELQNLVGNAGVYVQAAEFRYGTNSSTSAYDISDGTHPCCSNLSRYVICVRP